MRRTVQVRGFPVVSVSLRLACSNFAIMPVAFDSTESYQKRSRRRKQLRYYRLLRYELRRANMMTAKLVGALRSLCWHRLNALEIAARSGRKAKAGTISGSWSCWACGGAATPIVRSSQQDEFIDAAVWPKNRKVFTCQRCAACACRVRYLSRSFAAALQFGRVRRRESGPVRREINCGCQPQPSLPDGNVTHSAAVSNAAGSFVTWMTLPDSPTR